MQVSLSSITPLASQVWALCSTPGRMRAVEPPGEGASTSGLTVQSLVAPRWIYRSSSSSISHVFTGEDRLEGEFVCSSHIVTHKCNDWLTLYYLTFPKNDELIT